MKYDVCIVGSGIVGMACAYWCSKRNLKVLVVEKNTSCFGASIRNFGLFWAIGQEDEYTNEVEISKQVYQEFFKDTAIWNKPSGSLGLAYHTNDFNLINEYQALHPQKNHIILNAKQVQQKFPYVNKSNLKGALYSSNEITWNSREGIAQMAEWLQKKHNVSFLFNCNAIKIEGENIICASKIISASKFIIAGGAEFKNLFPEVYLNSGILKCKLQMMKAKTDTVIEPALFSATSFIHYPAFINCPSLLKTRDRIILEQPNYIKFGINLLVSQNNYNELIIGDSHEYGEDVSPFNNVKIDDLILEGVKKIIPNTSIEITERWHGVYCKHPTKKYFTAQPNQNTLIINAMAGAGMTLSFGITKKLIETFI